MGKSAIYNLDLNIDTVSQDLRCSDSSFRNFEAATEKHLSP